MKPVIIIAIAFVLLIPLSVFAQEESLSELTARLDAENLQKANEAGSIVEPSNSNPPQQPYDEIDCPSGTYYGLDNQGNPACRDNETNQIVDPNLELVYDSQTGEIILDTEQEAYGWIAIIVVIIIIAIILSVSRKSSKSISLPRRGWTEIEKEQVRQRQRGLCQKCFRPPPRWEYDHIDVDRSNNELDNCQGLCPNCHSTKTHEGD